LTTGVQKMGTLFSVTRHLSI